MNSESRKLMSVAVVPAQAGTFLLEDVFSEDGLTLVSFAKIPVIAWRIMTYRAGDRVHDEADPISYEISDHSDVAIKHPDGRVDDGAGSYFDSESVYLEYRLASRIPAYPFVCGEC
jgi:hypothetical protein